MIINEEKRMIMAEDIVGDMVIKHMGGGVHVSPIESIVEHAHHGRPQQKRKTPLCSTH